MSHYHEMVCGCLQVAGCDVGPIVVKHCDAHAWDDPRIVQRSFLEMRDRMAVGMCILAVVVGVVVVTILLFECNY